MEGLRRSLFPAFANNDDVAKVVPVNVLGAFFEDPSKLVPRLFAVLGMPMPSFSAATNVPEILVALGISYSVSCKVFNTLISDRDAILASNAEHAVKVLTSLRRG